MEQAHVATAAAHVPHLHWSTNRRFRSATRMPDRKYLDRWGRGCDDAVVDVVVDPRQIDSPNASQCRVSCSGADLGSRSNKSEGAPEIRVEGVGSLFAVGRPPFRCV